MVNSCSGVAHAFPFDNNTNNVKIWLVPKTIFFNV